MTKSQSIYTKAELTEIKKYLPRGYAKILAEVCNCTEGIINHTLAGKAQKNFEILARAAQMASENKIMLEEAKKEFVDEINNNN